MSCLYPQEVCTLLLAAHLLGDQISLLNWLGFALCLSGISLHVALKALHSRGTVASSPRLSITDCPAIQPPLTSCCCRWGHVPDGSGPLRGYRVSNYGVSTPR